MSINQSQTQITEQFSILQHLPKNCGYTVCNATKEKLKKEMGKKKFEKVCKLVNLK